MAEELSPSAYVVLGLIARHGPMTPYELKARVEDTVGYYWPIPHAQLYRDPPRLAERGLLEERAEEHGRRRRVFHLTGAGREALDRWLADPTSGPPETRNPALLKLTFVDLGPSERATALARQQAAQHREWLELYRNQLAENDPARPDALARARLLDVGIRHERAYVDFWEELAGN
ncbi:MAG TPA: PadR family transcriptional regulator [Amycolatopsis sp.]|uniref:PadR family transcriptional regulator n=1 Tax=Amycolatopsis sp. TaxID=37632 RepID=UPI002B4A94F5|nr:PadR family transcriptional regulator [Amycolatopsis sp.]HKS46903.1 PadR family transcriptional regulator [Amycolatopsis sp.]